MIGAPLLTDGCTMNRSPSGNRPADRADRCVLAWRSAVGVVEFPQSVALAAHLRRPLRVQPDRIHDRAIAGAREMQRVAARWIAIGPDVFGGGAVAALAGDSEFGCGGVHGLRKERVGPERRAERGLAERGVTGERRRRSSCRSLRSAVRRAGA